ncbi:MAG: NUDIX hydrolase [Gammaproteobacteria bacterium]|jgi:ADP-ribose pyrophosphatase YjhB (NUDIX family)
MIWTPRTTVAAVIERDDRFLMVREDAGTGDIVINQPAGHLEESETLLDAVVRESLEETAWHITPEALVGIYKWRIPPDGLTYVRYCFAARALSEDSARTLDDGILAADWMTAEAIRRQSRAHRSPMVQQCIDDYLTGRRYPLELIHEIA